MKKQIKTNCLRRLLTTGDGIRGYSEYVSSTEKYGIKRADHYYRSKLYQINEAMKKLSFLENAVLRETYFYEERQPVMLVCERIGMTERSYYRIKREAVEKLAFYLNIK
ncbi:DNA-directed RNA polymerase specialized sigma subunit [Croceifilum oryzae]|uniref:DNA-directed RNA polymerase specialized sigma subunit n=1 Tax=Croceifilum oryzae TaxID=1553429 RepID=A0AAJ1TFD3_9BACL|nr:hypothetical protein [Croceifilum oryzae]MDQ0417399.1 DNA-directed RNA polymerase specialized sigma subunit [Croceifilum oryzae]